MRGDPDALLIVEFAEEDQLDNLQKLKQLAELMVDLGFGWNHLPRKWGGVVDVVEPAMQTAIADFRTSGLNVMMSMKQEGKPAGKVELPKGYDDADRSARIRERARTFIMPVVALLFIGLFWFLAKTFTLVFVFVPLVQPAILALNIDPLWFAVLVAVNFQTTFLSPPLATAAYYLKAVAPDWTLTDIHWGMAEFMVLQLIGLLVVMLFPQIGLWFPHWLYGK